MSYSFGVYYAELVTDKTLEMIEIFLLICTVSSFFLKERNIIDIDNYTCLESSFKELSNAVNRRP